MHALTHRLSTRGSVTLTGETDEWREVDCNEGPCLPDCTGSWGDWSACSEECGGGTQTRIYRITTLQVRTLPFCLLHCLSGWKAG